MTKNELLKKIQTLHLRLEFLNEKLNFLAKEFSLKFNHSSCLINNEIFNDAVINLRLDEIEKCSSCDQILPSKN